MAMDLTGIGNVNEFYSHHYLDALLESDLKGLLARWEEREQEESRTPPHKLLARCAEEFYKAKARVAATASRDDRFTETHPLNVRLAEALGYPYEAGAYEMVEEKLAIPVLVSLQRDGNPYLWLVETAWGDEDHELLNQFLFGPQVSAILSALDTDAQTSIGKDWEGMLSLIFRREQPPRWVILLAGGRIILAERHKWGQGKYLLFDVDELLGRKQADTLKAAAALLARDALCPDDGTVLHDTLDENSHKHAFAVSSDLKYGLRRAVELLANEYVWYQRTVAKQALYGDEDLARKLTVESLTYLYRLLFLFYAEARGKETGIVDLRSDEYRLGYSLESLRDLEQVPLTTEAAQNGYFIDHSLRMLCKLVNDGFSPQNKTASLFNDTPMWLARPFPTQKQIDFDGSESAAAVVEPEEPAFEPVRYLDHGFSVTGLESPLFDPKRTLLLSSVKFRNVVLQEVIQLLSLSREGGRGNRRRERGRISYAELGINQLGAVYEGLLSYSGFFAQERLYEVKPAGSSPTDETQQSYFVPESDIAKYTDEEFVTVEVHGGERGERRRKKYEKGTFVFRLAGRDRQKSASYYTPECLTQCVVKYALKELLKDKKADEILKLTVCEPAMGSGAFLNEAVNQLADAYLECKQKETGKTIPPGEYPIERQKVKAYLASHNCYGVDLNPIAAELAKVSLWLNTIYPESRCPWFGLRLAVGNSLIGVKRAVFRADDLKRKKSKDRLNWLGLVPQSLKLGPTWEERPPDGVYHFLVPDEGMAAFDTDKVIKELAKDDVARIKDWRKDFCKPFEKHDVAKLLELSAAVDSLWKQVIKERQVASRKTNQPIPVWGQETPKEKSFSIPAQEKVAEELERYYTAYRRLKLAMDYWCALWFWPISESAKLPSRDVFLFDMELILKGTIQTPQPEAVLGHLFPGEPVNPEHVEFVGHFGMVNVEELLQKNERLRIVDQVAKQIRFHHWEMRFADLFAERGGFDLIVGNPPWVKVEWNEGGVLSDYEPIFALRDISATEMSEKRNSLLADISLLQDYLRDFESQQGTKAILGSYGIYPLLKGVQANLYKAFLLTGWHISTDSGHVGFIHPRGLLDDPNGERLRKESYRRLCLHCHFRNELMLFDILHTREYSLNVYSARSKDEIDFVAISNLLHPSTIDSSFSHDGLGQVPTIKSDDGKWNIAGHRSRVVRITHESLLLFAQVYGAAATACDEGKLPLIYSNEVIQVLRKLSQQCRKMRNLAEGWFPTQCWNETGAQQEGIIRRVTTYPSSAIDWVLSGPHIFVGTPLFQTPNQGCRNPLDYSPIDLQSIKADYLPRTNFVPDLNSAEYLARGPHWNGQPVSMLYRHVHREMIDTTSERTLACAIIPPQVHYIHTLLGVAFESTRMLLEFNALASSIVVDFYVKTIGAGHCNVDSLLGFPFPPMQEILSAAIRYRILRLNCITTHYCELWNAENVPNSSMLLPTKEDPRLAFGVDTGVKQWSTSVAARSDYERRQLLIELDALAAIALEIDEAELVSIYRIGFPVLRKNDRKSTYDQVGRRVPSTVIEIAHRHSIEIRNNLSSSSLMGNSDLLREVDVPGIGQMVGIAWEDPKMEPRKTRVYPPPFTKCDREEDMRQAYRTFQERLRTLEETQ